MRRFIPVHLIGTRTDAVFTLNTPGHPTIEVPLNQHTTKFGENECVLCTVSVDANQLSVERRVTFHRFQLIQHEGRTNLRWMSHMTLV